MSKSSTSDNHNSNPSNARKDVYKRNRILICAPSNAAIDEIVGRLVESPPKLASTNGAHCNGANQSKFINELSL